MILISFSGLDGSGKSEQIKNLVGYLKKNRLRYKLIHAVQNSIANKIAGRGKTSGRKNPESRTQAGIAGILARKIAFLIDILLFRISLLRMRRIDVIIADRYFYDTLVNIYFLEGNRDPHLPPFLLHLIRRPEIPFYLSVDPHIAHRRKNDQGMAYLSAKHDLFEKLKKRMGLVEIQDDDIQKIANQVANTVERKLLSKNDNLCRR